MFDDSLPTQSLTLLAPLAVFARPARRADGGERWRRAGAAVSGGPGRPTGDAVADYQRAVRAAPDNADAYAGLGDAYLARARETGDPGYYSRAERSFGAALRRKPADLGALIGAGNAGRAAPRLPRAAAPRAARPPRSRPSWPGR